MNDLQVIKEIKPVQGNQIIIDLPKNFFAQQVEVIVIPYQIRSVTADREQWQHDFQSISQVGITEEQVKIASWQIEEF